MKGWYLLAGLLWFTPLAWAELPPPVDFEVKPITAGELPKELREVVGLMSPENAFRANFLMSTYSKGSTRPVNQKGRFTFDNAQGMLVQTIEPEKEALLISQEGVFSLDTQGKHHLAEDPGIFPKLREFFEGRFEQLASEAKLRFGTQDYQWELIIEPESGTLAGRVTQMRLRGERGALLWVRIAEKDLTVTSIRLYSFQRFKHPLGETEFFYLAPVQDFIP
ncbi:MAG: hypothetical protein RRB13_11010 [bacterium]|nr:hypothetical protein [bacterium]